MDFKFTKFCGCIWLMCVCDVHGVCVLCFLPFYFPVKRFNFSGGALADLNPRSNDEAVACRADRKTLWDESVIVVCRNKINIFVRFKETSEESSDKLSVVLQSADRCSSKREMFTAGSRL